MRWSSLIRLACISSLIMFAACAGPRPRGETREETEELPAPTVQMSEYEDFDASPYADEPPVARQEIQHDVPEKLMQGHADAGVEETVQGYRVQVYSSLEKDSALRVETELKSWWRDQEASGGVPASLFPGGLPVAILFIQPYYRVRVGNFASRSAAERAQDVLERRFPGAFVVPDTVTIMR